MTGTATIFAMVSIVIMLIIIAVYMLIFFSIITLVFWGLAFIFRPLIRALKYGHHY